MRLDVLLDLLADAWRRVPAPVERVTSLTVHLAERDGVTVAAAVVEAREVAVSEEWVVAA